MRGADDFIRNIEWNFFYKRIGWIKIRKIKNVRGIILVRDYFSLLIVFI